MSFVSTVHKLIFRRSSTYAFTMIATAFFFERAYDIATESIFESVNKGKLWKHIKDKYE